MDAFRDSREILSTEKGVNPEKIRPMYGISANRLLRLFDKLKIPVKKVLSRAIAIDEFKGDAGRVQIVVMDLSKAFKEAVRRQLDSPLIIADRFHYMRQAYWAFDRVGREVQHDLYKKDRIRMKKIKKYYGNHQPY